MSAFMGRDQAQKEFLKLYDTLTGAHSRWEVWKDMVVIFATTISNSVDKRFYEQREKMYMDALNNRYTHAQQETFSNLFAMLVDIYEDGCQNGEYRDFLGELFMMLNLGNDAGGQFFTPYHLCQMMARICIGKEKLLDTLERKGWVSVDDPACGAGATLIAAADMVREWGVNYQKTVYFTGQDIDFTTALMCYIQLSLLGCAGHVYIGSTLSDPDTGSALHGGKMTESTWLTPMWFSDIWHGRREVDKMTRAIRSLEKLEQREPPKEPPKEAPKPMKEPKQKPKKPKKEQPKPDNMFTMRDDGQVMLI